MCVFFNISKTVYCRKLVRFRTNTKMAESKHNAKIIFFSSTYFSVINWITLISYYFSYSFLTFSSSYFSFSLTEIDFPVILPFQFILQLTELTLTWRSGSTTKQRDVPSLLCSPSSTSRQRVAVLNCANVKAVRRNNFIMWLGRLRPRIKPIVLPLSGVQPQLSGRPSHTVKTQESHKITIHRQKLYWVIRWRTATCFMTIISGLIASSGFYTPVHDETGGIIKHTHCVAR